MRFDRFLERSFLNDGTNRKTESEYLFYHQSCYNLANNFLNIKDWNSLKSKHKYNLSKIERFVLGFERAILMAGFSHGQKQALIYFFTGKSSKKQKNILERVTAKLFVLENYFNEEYLIKDYLYSTSLNIFKKKINL